MFLSPSLVVGQGNGGIAYEIKFLLSEEQARALQDRLSQALPLDPHADPNHQGGYATTTLYCDTADLQVLRGVGRIARRKHRLRRYGGNGTVYLERKVKVGTRVRKQRTGVPLHELHQLASTEVEPQWAGAWFGQHIQTRGLRPVCRVSYDRVAYVGMLPEGPLRVTLDRNLRGEACDQWHVEPLPADGDLLSGAVIAEFKFQDALPSLGKRVIEDLRLEPGPASKYRRVMRSWHPVEEVMHQDD